MKKFLLLVALALALWNAPALATACTAGCIQYGFNATFSGTTVATTLTGVGSGHTLNVAVLVSPSGNTFSSLSDGSACTFTGTKVTAGGKDYQLAYCPNTASGSLTITLTVGTTCTNCNIYVEEWSGDSSTPGDGGNQTYTNGAATSSPSGSITTTGSADRLWTVFFDPDGVAGPPTLPSGYTAANSAVNSSQVWTAYKTSVAAGAQNPTWTSGTSQFDNYVGVEGMKTTGGGGSTCSGGQWTMMGAAC